MALANTATDAGIATRPEPPDIPRSILLLRLVWRTFFCVFAVVVGNVVLTAVPQAREAMLLFAANPDRGFPQTFSFVLSVLYWAASAWFVARILLGRAFERDSLGTSPTNDFVEWVAAVLPRLLALAATLPVCILTWQADPWLGGTCGATSVLFIVFLVLRRKFGDDENQAGNDRFYAEFDHLGPNSLQICIGLLGFSVVVLAGLWNLNLARVGVIIWLLLAVALYRRELPSRSPRLLRTVFRANFTWAILTLALMVAVGDEIELARQLGAPAILLCALGSWTLFGGLVLTYMPMTRGWPGLAAWLPPVLYLLSSFWESHWVAQRPLEPTAEIYGRQYADWREKRKKATDHFNDWIGEHDPGKPIYVVAVVGGASRAGFWAGSVLARLEDEASSSGSRFSEDVFALSTVSGGSLGAAAWVADLAQVPPGHACPDNCRRQRVEEFLGHDFLSPVIGRMLFPDLFVRFVPFPLFEKWTAQADRSLGLEQSWVQDWDNDSKREDWRSAMQRPVFWARPLTDLYAVPAGQTARRLPSLFLNTVRLNDGQRFVQSNLATELPLALDLLNPAAYDTGRLTLAQAVHNSARFPYVSPAGIMLAAPPLSSETVKKVPRLKLGRLGDAGYHEGSGAATLVDLLEMLSSNGDQLRPKGPDSLRRRSGHEGLWACRDGWREEEPGCTSDPSPVIAIILDAAPSRYPEDHVRNIEGRPKAPRSGIAKGGIPLPELLAPVFGGLSTRTELSYEQQVRLSGLVGRDPRALIELRMPVWRTTIDDEYGQVETVCKHHDDQPSMNWALDRCSRARLSAAAAEASPPSRRFGLHPTLAQRSLLQNLERLRALVRSGASDFGEEARR